MGSMMALHFGSEKAQGTLFFIRRGYSELYELLHLKMMAKSQFYARRGMINISLPVTEGMFDQFEASLVSTIEECANVILETVSL